MGNYVSSLFFRLLGTNSNTPDSLAPEQNVDNSGVTSLEDITTTACDTKKKNKAWDKVKACLHSVKVSQTDATQVQRELEGELFNKWEEKCEVTEARKIAIENIQDFLDDLQKAYKGNEEEMRLRTSGIKWAEEWSNKIMEFKYNVSDNSSARYGMIAFGKSKDGKFVDCMYCLYKLDFKITPQKIVTETDYSIAWGLISWTSVQQEERERVLGIVSLKRIKNFFRYKALQGFYNEGLIDEINLVPSVEDPDENEDE